MKLHMHLHLNKMFPANILHNNICRSAALSLVPTSGLSYHFCPSSSGYLESGAGLLSRSGLRNNGLVIFH